MVLKAGYYNKIGVHGDESGEANIKSLESLFSDDNRLVQAQMRSIVNRLDSYGNSALHYAKPYPNQRIAKLLLLHGAKLEVNDQGLLNLHPRTLEEHLFEHCIKAEGDDIDDEDFKIRINFQLFERPVENDVKDLNRDGVSRRQKKAWELLEAEGVKGAGGGANDPLGTGRVDTKRLEYFSDISSLHYLVKHPVLSSFLEMELNSLRWRYLLDFFVYFAFVIVLFLFLSSRWDRKAIRHLTH